MKSLCVFCGSSPGANPRYAETAKALGGLLAERGIRLIYGGGDVGLMGILADAVLDAGGEVIGVIPKALLDKEVGHQGLTQLIVVASMHERKARMVDLADAFLALPGGFGTFEELCEVLTWAQLGFIAKPCGLLNIAGYFDPLLALFDRAVEERFLRPQHRALVVTGTVPAELLQALEKSQPLPQEKWIDRGQT